MISDSKKYAGPKTEKPRTIKPGYRKPNLVKFGRITELTSGGGTGSPDGPTAMARVPMGML